MNAHNALQQAENVNVVQSDVQDIKTQPKALQKGLGGRPLKFTNEIVLRRHIDKYFATKDDEKRPYTLSGLAYELGIDRQTLLNYAKRDMFFGTIKKARERIEISWEERLARQTGNVAGVIFHLKNNFGYKDKSETETVNTHLHLHSVARAMYEEADKLRSVPKKDVSGYIEPGNNRT
jgi:hypothetical protein